MGIAKYLKEIGRGKEGARALPQEQAADLMGQILDGAVSDLELGAFWMAMRIKGESAEEMAGFLEACKTRIRPIRCKRPVVIIPSYNGARKLPGLTTLLACLLAQKSSELPPNEQFTVLVHSGISEASRIPTQGVFEAVLTDFYNIKEDFKPIEYAQAATELIASKTPYFYPTSTLLPALDALLQRRRTIGVRSSVHSLVKLLNPVQTERALILSSYTHPEYLTSMTDTLGHIKAHAMLLRGTEGESVADARRRPRMDGFINGKLQTLCAAQEGSLSALPDLPSSCEVAPVAAYTCAVLRGEKPIPAPIAAQVEQVLLLLKQIQ